jgi:decaprenylphospho-beta-D-ribofuranose 2-oxidase
MPRYLKIVNAINYFLSKTRDNKKQIILFTDYNFMHNKIPDIKDVYRPHGFLEFQPLIPRKSSVKAVNEIFRLCRKHNCQSLLCGVKAHKEDDYILSYSGDGYSIGIDIQIRGRRQEHIKKFVRELFEYTLENGGKTFLAKDEMLPRDIFERMYPNYNEFLHIKALLDPPGLFKSDMYRRLLENQ